MMPDDTGSATSAGLEGDSIRLIVTGAFLLEPRWLLGENEPPSSSARQPPGGRTLARTERDAAWEPTSTHGDTGSYASGGGLIAAPQTIVMRRRVEITPTSDSKKTPSTPFLLTHVNFDLRSFGVVTLRGEVQAVGIEPSPKSLIGLTKLAQQLKKSVWLRPDPAGLFPDLAEELRAMVNAMVNEHVTASASTGPATNDGVVPKNVGRLLWLHPVLVCDGAPDGSPTEVLAAATPSTETAIVSFRGGVLATGIGMSAICRTTVVAGAGDDVDDALSLMAEQWAVIAAMMLLDADLGERLDALHNDTQRSHHSKAEDQVADNTFRTYEHAMRVMTTVDSGLAFLGGDMLKVWESIADVQGIDQQMVGVRRKLDLLREGSEWRSARASAASERRTNMYLTVLTVVGGATAILGVVSFVVGDLSDDHGHAALRYVTLILAFTLVAYVLHGLRRKPPRRG